MSRAFITIGDKTSHGGTVISGDQTFLIHGKAVGGIGDLTFCPRCNWTFPITSGAEDRAIRVCPEARAKKNALGFKRPRAESNSREIGGDNLNILRRSRKSKSEQ